MLPNPHSLQDQNTNICINAKVFWASVQKTEQSDILIRVKAFFPGFYKSIMKNKANLSRIHLTKAWIGDGIRYRDLL